MASLIIIAVCVAITVAIVAYKLGFSNGFKEACKIFHTVLDNSILRFGKTVMDELTDPPGTDEQE